MRAKGLRHPLAFGAAAAIASLASGCSAGPGPTVITIAPDTVSLDSGAQTTLTVTVTGNRQVTCTATGGTLVQNGQTLTYTAPVASAEFEIRCASGADSGTAQVLVSGPITLEYSSALPNHATEPTSALPIMFISQFGPGPNFGGQNIPGFTCDRPAWLGGNHWRCEFPLVPPSTILARVHDERRNAAEGLTEFFVCTTITFNGVAALPQAAVQSGCVARFR